MIRPAGKNNRKNNGSEVWEQDRRHHVHPFHNFVSYDEHGALIMDEGRGAYLTDIDGNRYFDAVGGMWCTNIGLGRQEMADAIAEQVLQLAYANPFTDMSNEPAARLSAKLAELAPGDL
ncbi:MAG: aminotransferase class III-fold pyridoxal phosphate-dependent enzyme, partial [Woeseiaceae bacterium]|nr:aminotransferase class III-fold pyridoxal phosphate-dependent enzyme [Woeseiaceae bacterium]